MDRWICPKVLRFIITFLGIGVRFHPVCASQPYFMLDIMYKYVFDILAIDSKNPIRSKGVVILVIG